LILPPFLVTLWGYGPLVPPMGTSGVIPGYETRMQIVLEEKAVYQQSYSKTVGLQIALENGRDTDSGTDISLTFMNHGQEQLGNAAVMHSAFSGMNLLGGKHMETMVTGAAQSMLGLGPRFGARQRSDSRVPKIDI
jgi:hypothetical protein